MRTSAVIITLSACLSIAAALWYAVDHQYIIITSGAEYLLNRSQAKNREICVHWYHGHEMHQDTRMILWPEEPADRIKNIVNGWLTHVQEEHLLSPALHVESVALASHDTCALINFSEPLFATATSIAEKAGLLEALIMTIHQAEPSLTHTHFLVKNTLGSDEHIDLQQNFPLAGFCAPAQKMARLEPKALQTVVINPAGDSKNTGRIINHEFERTLTFNAATLLAALLRDTPMHIVLTRSLGETVDHMHILHVVNQRPTDLFIDLRCYQTKHSIPEIQIFTYAVDTGTDFWQKKSSQLALVPITKTYLKHAATSYAHATRLTHLLAQEPGLQVYPPRALPLTPLVGLTQPGIIMECGVRESADLAMICHTLARLLDFYHG